jgi:hypothetical protein
VPGTQLAVEERQDLLRRGAGRRAKPAPGTAVVE